MKIKFRLSICFGAIWFVVSALFAVGWANEVIPFLPKIYVWWVIAGIALLPGFLMSSMFFSNLLHLKHKKYPCAQMDTTVILCAHNEEKSISRAIMAIVRQKYAGHIHILVVDNASTDCTMEKIKDACSISTKNRSIQYLYCPTKGKACALNMGLRYVRTPYFLTVDADTFLHPQAVQQIMGHIAQQHNACVAGNLFVCNTKGSIITRMQNYDYLLSIAAIKRFQGSYCSTLVAQGAFSAYSTNAVRKIGGWSENTLGEDIVLTYRLLQQGYSSGYEPNAVGYTTVPITLTGLYRQRKRWAIGMLEGLHTVPPHKQGSKYAKYFTTVNLSVIYLDLAYVFGFIPGVIWAVLGDCYFVGPLTVFALFVCAIFFFSSYIYQVKLNIPFRNTVSGFVLFLLFFQLIQSCASIHGYLTYLLHKKSSWK